MIATVTYKHIKCISFWIVLVLSIVFINSNALAQQTHNVSFQTTDGIYGHVVIKTAPRSMGTGYIVIDSQRLVYEGVRGSSQISGITFPLTSRKYTIDLNGSGCMKLNSPTPDCGGFSMQYLGASASDYTEVGFSESTKQKHNDIRKETGDEIWVNRGFAQDITITEVRGSDLNSIRSAINTASTGTASSQSTSSTQQQKKPETNDQQSSEQQESKIEQQRQEEVRQRQIQANQERQAEAERQERQRRLAEAEAQRKAEADRQRRAAAEQARNDLGQVTQNALQSGMAVGLSLTGDQLGLYVGMVSDKWAFMFNMGTNELGAITGDEFIEDNPVFSTGLDVGFDVANTQALMMYVGAFIDFQSELDKANEFGVSGGFTGLVGEVFVYQVGYRANADSEKFALFSSLGLQFDF